MGPIIVVDDKKYEPLIDNIEGVYDHDGVRFTAKGQWRPVNQCSSCHRFDVEEIVLYSIEELVEHGWLREVDNAGSTMGSSGV